MRAGHRIGWVVVDLPRRMEAMFSHVYLRDPDGNKLGARYRVPA